MFLKGCVIGFLLILIALCLAAPFAAEDQPLAADEFTIGGYRLKIASPVGYCPLSLDNQIDNRIISGLQTKKPDSLIPLVFANCTELADFHQGKVKNISDFGFVFIKKKDGSPQTMPGISRSGMLAIEEQEFKKIDQTQQVVLQRAKYARDDAAVYLSGVASKNVKFGNSAALVEVTGVTLVNSVPLIVEMVRPGSADSDIDALVKNQSEYLHNLLRLNGDTGDNFPTVLTYNAPITVGEVVMALALVCLCVVLAFWHPGRKRPSAP